MRLDDLVRSVESKLGSSILDALQNDLMIPSSMVREFHGQIFLTESLSFVRRDRCSSVGLTYSCEIRPTSESSIAFGVWILTSLLTGAGERLVVTEPVPDSQELAGVVLQCDVEGCGGVDWQLFGYEWVPMSVREVIVEAVAERVPVQFSIVEMDSVEWLMIRSTRDGLASLVAFFLAFGVDIDLNYEYLSGPDSGVFDNGVDSIECRVMRTHI